MRSPSAPAVGDLRSMYQPDSPVMSGEDGGGVTARAGSVGGFPIGSPAVSATIERCLSAERPLLRLLTILRVLDCTMMPYQVCTLTSVMSAWLRYLPVPKYSHTLPSFGFLPASIPAVIGCTLPSASSALNSWVPEALEPLPSLNDQT